MRQPSLFEPEDRGPAAEVETPDQAARTFAVNPAHHVVLEASAGTGKTRVLVERYVRLVLSGVDPRHILAMTFTRKAAAEMRARVLDSLARRATENGTVKAIYDGLASRLGDVNITTIDGFCFGLLREFPLEADVDPAFDVADETEMARFVDEALTRTIDQAHGLAVDEEPVRLLLARIKVPVLADALRLLVDRRHVSVPAVARFVARASSVTSGEQAAVGFTARIKHVLPASEPALVGDGPVGSAAFRRIVADLTAVAAGAVPDPSVLQPFRGRLEAYFLTRDGKPRQRVVKPYRADQFTSAAAKRRHDQAVSRVSPDVLAALTALDRDLDALLARGVLRLLVIAVSTYERMLEEEGLLDFAAMLDRTVALLARQEEFARSRLKLQARYHHLLIDEFQDTSRVQWRLVDLLIGAWAEGEGAADAATSVFIVGDRKQSIYRFRHAEVSLLDEAAERIAALGGGRPVRHAISASFRAVPELLSFVNRLSGDMLPDEEAPDAWRFGEADRFPTPPLANGGRRNGEPVVGIVAERSLADTAHAVATEIARLLASATVRDRVTGTRPMRPDDVAILFRARAGHQYFEEALEAHDVRTYVYKGLGFFDAPEVQDLQALTGVLAAPESDLAAAAFLRSRFVRLSDQALADLAPRFADALFAADAPAVSQSFSEPDASLFALVREALPRWRALTTAIVPSDLVDRVIRDTAFACEWSGPRVAQARENVKKVRALIRRIESRGYATFDRLAQYFETLRAGDDANAVVDAAGAVSLMTIHAAKGLEFPVVFVVNLHAPGRGRGAGFSVIEAGVDGEPEVTFGSTPGTALDDRRENEELRRLLYVAVTRARDRLYLATLVNEAGASPKPRRSLAALLPFSLIRAFSDAATAPVECEEVEWEGGADTFALRVCRPTAPPVRPEVVDEQARGLATAPVPVLVAPVAKIRSVTAWLATAEGNRQFSATGGAPASNQGDRGDRGDRLVGTLVHRLLQHMTDPGLVDTELALRAGRLLAAGEVIEGETEDLLLQAVRLFRQMAEQPGVAEVLGSGECLYEVPFSAVLDDFGGTVLRGVVDCVVVPAEGPLEVLEFKTGRPRPEHQVQADVYARAIGAAFGRPAQSRLFYAQESQTGPVGR